MLKKEGICVICHSKTNNYSWCCNDCEAARGRPLDRFGKNVDVFLCYRCDNCKPLVELAIGIWWCCDCAREVLSAEEYYALSINSLEDELK